MANDGVESIRIGQSPGDVGDSQRHKQRLPSTSESKHPYSIESDAKREDGSERAVSPQENHRCTNAPSEFIPGKFLVEPESRDAIAPASRRAVLAAYHEAERRIDRIPVCRAFPCPVCSDRTSEIRRHIRLCQLREAEWYHFRQTVEQRIKRRLKAVRAQLLTQGIGYHRTRLFMARLHMIPTLDLVGNSNHLAELVALVSALDWRPPGEDW